MIVTQPAPEHDDVLRQGGHDRRQRRIEPVLRQRLRLLHAVQEPAGRRPGADRLQPLHRRRRDTFSRPKTLSPRTTTSDAGRAPGLRGARPTATATSTSSGRTRSSSMPCSLLATLDRRRRELLQGAGRRGRHRRRAASTACARSRSTASPGARTSSFPSLSIANGAPSGAGAPDTIALGWSDGADGLNHEHALVQLSGNGGAELDRSGSGRAVRRPSATSPSSASRRTARPLRRLRRVPRPVPRQHDQRRGASQGVAASRRRLGHVARAASTTLDRGAVGDARASSANALIDEFIGDYNTVDATNGGAVLGLTTTRSNAGVLRQDSNAFRQATVDEDARSPGGASRRRRADDCPDDVRQHGHPRGGGRRPIAVRPLALSPRAPRPSPSGWGPGGGRCRCRPGSGAMPAQPGRSAARRRAASR